MLNYSRLSAPVRDGEILLEPSIGDVLDGIARNRELFQNSDQCIAGQPLRSLRAQLRRELGLPAEQVLIATGHQPEFFHCGVWVKGVLAHAIARKLRGVAVQWFVDHDTFNNFGFWLPVEQDGGVELHRIPEKPPVSGLLYEQLPCLNDNMLDSISDELRIKDPRRFEESLCQRFLEGCQSAASPSGWVDQFAGGCRSVDRAFGIELEYRRASDCDFTGFFAELIFNAETFAHAYNRALSAYRVSQGIHGQRPIPDLRIERNVVETPLWVLLHDGARHRLYVEMQTDHVVLRAESTPIHTCAKNHWTSARQVQHEIRRLTPRGVLRPRALAFTLWVRLFVSDFFIHGIGGAKYDRITDRIIEDYFNIKPPEYACASATAHLDLPKYPGCVDEKRQLLQLLRELTYNPQRYVSNQDELVRLRESWIDRSTTLRRESPDRRRERREVFQQIRRINAELAAFAESKRTDTLRTLERVDWRISADARAHDREYFYGLYGPDQLRSLKSRVDRLIQQQDAVAGSAPM